MFLHFHVLSLGLINDAPFCQAYRRALNVVQLHGPSDCAEAYPQREGTLAVSSPNNTPILPYTTIYAIHIFVVYVA